MKALALLVLFFCFSCCDASTEDYSLFAANFMPENDLASADDISHSMGITEREFDEACADVQAFFGPIFAKHKLILKVVKEWSNSTVNSYTFREGAVQEVHALGGLARSKYISKDGFLAVLGHEIGHALAGVPRYSGIDWASVEGESDRYSTAVALRHLFAPQEMENAMAILGIPEYPKALCDRAWAAEDDQLLCYRIMQAGKQLADLLSQGQATWDGKDPQVVSKTFEGHPGAQCRAQTFFAGALDQSVFDLAVIPESESESYQYSAAAGEVGERPRCWFKPGV